MAHSEPKIKTKILGGAQHHAQTPPRWEGHSHGASNLAPVSLTPPPPSQNPNYATG